MAVARWYGVDTDHGNKRIFQDGKEIYSTDAYSGRRQEDGSFDYSVDYQKQKSTGPIPEGEYFLEPEKAQHITTVDAILGYFGKGAWPKSVPAWGSDRMWINGAKYGRSNFSIHGGFTPGGAGCIDVLCNSGSVIFKIQQVTYPKHTIKLFVKY